MFLLAFPFRIVYGNFNNFDTFGGERGVIDVFTNKANI